MYVRTRENYKVHGSEVCVCPLAEGVCPKVCVHEKFSIMKDGKYTNFNMAMNVVLLAVCSPIFRLCVSQ